MARYAVLILILAATACRSPEPTARYEAPQVETTEPPPIEAGVAPPAGPYAPGFDALHYDIVLQLPDSGSFIRGMTQARVRLESPRHDTLSLDFSGLAVDYVDWNAEPVPFRHAAGKLHIAVPPLLRAGDTLTVSVGYHGSPDDGLILGENIHGRPTAFADNWPNRARFWFPSIDHPSDKATVRFTVNAGDDRQVISNGARQGSDGWVWETDAPIPTYTMVIGAAEFIVNEIGTVCRERCVEVTTWLFPPDTVAAAPSFRRAAEMVEYYSDLIAPFPYEKLAHVQSSTRFGGMENVSAIFYPEQPLAAGQDIELTVAHETVHQWFGDAVTESDWHHLWLSEGFATYFAALFFEEADGETRFREVMDTYRQAYLSSNAVTLPIVNPEQDNLFALLNANNYQKGAWVLHMLRRMLGDDAFFEGIRTFYREHEHGTVLTDDLRSALEEASGRDLGVFFDQWVYSPGFPQYDVTWSWDGVASAANVRIEQIQPQGWPTFTTPVVVEFATREGAEERILEIDSRNVEATFELPAEPTALVVAKDVLSEVRVQP